MTVMDKIYAPFKIKESDFSYKSLNRLKLLGFLAIPGPIALCYLAFNVESLFANPLLMFTILIPLLATVFCLIQRPINYLTRMDKNLDEWERGLKHKSESFAFRVFVFSALALSLPLLISDSVLPKLDLNFTMSHLPFLFISFVITAYIIITNYMAWTVTPIPEDQEGFDSVAQNPDVSISLLQFIIGLISVLVIAYGFGYIVGHLLGRP